MIVHAVCVKLRRECVVFEFSGSNLEMRSLCKIKKEEYGCQKCSRLVKKEKVYKYCG